jgi:hypothetical protein
MHESPMTHQFRPEKENANSEGCDVQISTKQTKG